MTQNLHPQFDADLIQKQKYELIKQQAAVIEQMREALEESNALNINWSSDAEPETLAYFSEYQKVITIGTKALALQPCPEVLNKVRADAMRELYDWYVYQETAIQQDKAMVETFIAQRTEKGEA